jgi:hypothetical protein
VGLTKGRFSPESQHLLAEYPEFQEDLRQAEKFFAYWGQRAGNGAAAVTSWYRRVARRIPATAEPAANLRPASDRLWHVAHRDEPNATPPPGYDPTHIPSQAPLRTWQAWQQGESLLLLQAPHPGAAARQGAR